MIFIIVSFLVPLTVYFVTPFVANRLTIKPEVSKMPLLIGGVLFFLSWYVPSTIIIDGENTGFATHFLGGGVFTGFVWLYLTKRFNLKLSRFFQLISLYTLVSSLGVAVELSELTAVKLKLIDLSGSDTWWDLLANTLGAVVFWVIYTAANTLFQNGTSRKF